MVKFLRRCDCDIFLGAPSRLMAFLWVCRTLTITIECFSKANHRVRCFFKNLRPIVCDGQRPHPVISYPYIQYNRVKLLCLMVKKIFHGRYQLYCYEFKRWLLLINSQRYDLSYHHNCLMVFKATITNGWNGWAQPSHLMVF